MGFAWNTRELNIGKVRVANRLFFAPMSGISNKAVRNECRKYGAGLAFTEMISIHGIVRKDAKTMKLLDVSGEERPTAVQIYGRDPKIFSEAAQQVEGFADIIDINFGCPARTVVKGGSGSAIMREPDLIEKIVSSVVKSVSCPVTAKIRSGWDQNSINAVEVAKIIEGAGASAITVHPRTRAQGFTGLSDWNIIAQVKEAVSIPVIGNGDVKSPEDALRMVEMTSCDAVMIGRGALGNPWIFSRALHYIETGELLQEPSEFERLYELLSLAKDFVDLMGETIGCKEIRKFVKWFTKGMYGVSELRRQAMHAETLEEFQMLILPYIDRLKVSHMSVNIDNSLDVKDMEV